jgi:hypothetical protein
MSVQWSYSGLKTFQQCPKKYYHLKVAKDIVDQGGEAANYGKLVHKAAEDYIRDGIEIPEKFAYMRPILNAFNKIKGEKHCELEMGIAIRNGEFVACAFDAPDYWWHGIADLVIIDDSKAYLADYKTSKNAKYADTKQLDLLAAGVFLRFPEVKEIKSALAFVVSNEFIKKEHVRLMQDKYLHVMKPELDRLEAAMSNQVWNPISGALCGFCPVDTCVHHRKKR